MRYYEISYSTDLDVTGDIPQVSRAEIVGGSESIDDAFTYFKHPNHETVLKGGKKLDAKYTDLMSCAGLSTGKGLLVSDKFIALAEKYELPGCRVYPFDVFDLELMKSVKHNYLHIINFGEIKDSFDYRKSAFYVESKSGERESVEISGWDDWWNANLKQVEQDGRIIHAEKLFYAKSRFPAIIRMPFSAVIMISEELSDALAKNKISGVSAESANLKIISGAAARVTE